MEELKKLIGGRSKSELIVSGLVVEKMTIGVFAGGEEKNILPIIQLVYNPFDMGQMRRIIKQMNELKKWPWVESAVTQDTITFLVYFLLTDLDAKTTSHVLGAEIPENFDNNFSILTIAEADFSVDGVYHFFKAFNENKFFYLAIGVPQGKCVHNYFITKIKEITKYKPPYVPGKPIIN